MGLVLSNAPRVMAEKVVYYNIMPYPEKKSAGDDEYDAMHGWWTSSQPAAYPSSVTYENQRAVNGSYSYVLPFQTKVDSGNVVSVEPDINSMTNGQLIAWRNAKFFCYRSSNGENNDWTLAVASGGEQKGVLPTVSIPIIIRITTYL